MLSLPVLDTHRRPFHSLRVSVTDRCNLRCGYCMPEEEYVWLPRAKILRYGQIRLVVAAAARLGVDNVRLTGGEPLLRKDLWRLVEGLVATPGIRDVAMTTNGMLLPEHAQTLRAAGLSRLTVSLDSLDPARFRDLAGRDGLAATLAGLDAADAAGFTSTKLNTVVIRGANDAELPALVDFARSRGYEARFIEYMDVGGATRWTMDAVVPGPEILERIAAVHGPLVPEAAADAAAPAKRYRLADGTRIGLITSTTAPFCGTCDRARLTADGHLYTCLYGREGLDLWTPIQDGADEPALAALMAARWGTRSDRGAETRLAAESRTALAGTDELRKDPHLEMHTRGG